MSVGGEVEMGQLNFIIIIIIIIIIYFDCWMWGKLNLAMNFHVAFYYFWHT